MIIGISGKAQSGKDTIGKIIQYLTTTLRHSYHFEDFINPNVNYNYSDTIFPNSGSIWQIHKFADAVKDIVCMLTGCTRDQLEDDKFKNNELGSEWDKYKCYSNEGSHFPRFIFSTIEEYNTFKLERDSKTMEYDLSEAKLVKLTPRKLMQLIGTDMGRVIHPNIWCNAIMRDYIPINYPTLQDPSCEPILPKWIITDVRFPNEAKAIEDRSGFIIRVDRKQYVKYEGKIVETFNVHSSETGLDDYTFKYTIDNNGTIEELIDKVKDILIKESIL